MPRPCRSGATTSRPTRQVRSLNRARTDPTIRAPTPAFSTTASPIRLPELVERLDQRREERVAVQLRLGDVRGALHGEDLPGVPGPARSITISGPRSPPRSSRGATPTFRSWVDPSGGSPPGSAQRPIRTVTATG